MRLFYSGNSPFVRKVMVVAHELELAAGIEIDPTGAHPIDRKAPLVTQNPLGKVPTLVLDDGTQLFDSPVIAEYLASRSPKGITLLPASGPERWRVLMEQALADGMLDAALLARYEAMLRPKEQQFEPWVAGQMAKLTAAVERMEALPVDPSPTIGSIAIACALGYLDLRFPTMNWRASHPKRARWLDVFAQRPSMKATEPADAKKQ
jgi:glutathione S-transferase